MKQRRAIADTVSIIGRGRVLAQGNVASVIGPGAGSLEVGISQPERAAQVLQEAGLTVVATGHSLLVSGAQDASQITATLAGAGLYLERLVPARRDLGSAFLELASPDALGEEQRPGIGSCGSN